MSLSDSESGALLRQGESKEEAPAGRSSRSWPLRTMSGALALLGVAAVALGSGHGSLLRARTDRFLVADTVHNAVAPRAMLKVTRVGSQTETAPVAFAESSLKPEDVLIVDDGEQVWVWVGEEVTGKITWAVDAANYYRKSRSVQEMNGVRFGFQKKGKDASFRRAFEKALATPQMFQVTVTGDAETRLNPVLFDEGNLRSDDVFIVDTGKEDGLYLWLGKDAPRELTTAANDASSQYVKTTTLSMRATTVIFEGKEHGGAFKALFGEKGDEGGDGKVSAKGSSAQEKAKNGAMSKCGAWAFVVVITASVLRAS